MNGKELWALNELKDGFIKSAHQAVADSQARIGEPQTSAHLEGVADGFSMAADRLNTLLRVMNK